MIFVIWVGEEQTEWPRDRAVKCVTLPHRAAGSEPGSALVGWRVSDKLCSCSRLPSLYTCPGGGCRDRVLRANHCQGLRSGPGVVSTVVNVGHCICVLFTTQGDDLPVLYFGSWGGLSWFLCPWAPRSKSRCSADLGSSRVSKENVLPDLFGCLAQVNLCCYGPRSPFRAGCQRKWFPAQEAARVPGLGAPSPSKPAALAQGLFMLQISQIPGAPGWLSRLSARLQLRSRSRSS